MLHVCCFKVFNNTTLLPMMQVKQGVSKAAALSYSKWGTVKRKSRIS